MGDIPGLMNVLRAGPPDGRQRIFFIHLFTTAVKKLYQPVSERPGQSLEGMRDSKAYQGGAFLHAAG